ncbi:MAG: hypothetical protein HFJ34_05305 [Clostridia bacterium]|nr:hypothetical protein [Clostridia bacterium]
MDIRKLSEEERKKYIDGFKQYIANRNGSDSIENNQFVNSMVNNASYDAINNTSTRRDYSNYNTTWNRVQNIANDNLNRFSNMQNILDRNTRNEMVKPLEDYTNRKRQSMQSISNAIQEKKKQEDKQKEENEKLKSQVNEQFRKKNHSTVDQNQNKMYENPKANIKLANNEEVENANLKRIDTAQFFKTKQDAETGNVLGYITDKISTGVQSAGDSILNLYATDMLRNNENVRKIGKFLNEEGIDERIDEGNKRILETINNTNYQAKKTGISLSEQDFSEGIQTLGNATESVGAMAPSLAIGAFNPTAGLAVTGITASGSAMKQALDEGATPEQAQRAGVLKGAVEVATEKLFGGVKFFGKGTLDDIFTDKVLDKVSSRIGKFAVRQGYDIAGETIEENISNIAGYGIDKLVLNKDLPTLKQMLEDADETTKTTILSTLILKSLGAPINSNSLEVNNLTDKQKQDIQKIEKMLQDNDNLSQNNLNLQQNITNNQINPQTGQIINQENKLAQNGNIEQIDNSLANNKQVVYNNVESEGGIDGREIKEYERRIIDRGDRLYEEKENIQNREYNWKEYNEWEQSIKPISENNLTTKEKQLIDVAKTEHNKNILIYDENENNNKYSAGASKTTKDKIVVSRQQAEIFGLEKMIDHETVESDIIYNEIARDILEPVKDIIINDNNFELQREKFWEGQGSNIPSDELIAKDIICDRFSEIRKGENLDYENVLTNASNSIIDGALNNYYKQVYGKELVNASSFDLQSNNTIQVDNVQQDMNINKKITRHDTIQKYRSLAKENIKNIATWKDKSNGLKYQLETMERNMYDIIPNRAEAKKMIDTYFEPIHEAEANKQRFINKYNEQIKEYKLNKYESEAVQVLGEYKYNPSFKTNGVDKNNKTILGKVNENIKKGRVDKQKVDEAIEIFRNIYDELFEIENNTLREYGYQEKPYRKGYFPHFIDDVPTTKVDKVLDKLGFKVDRRALPTDIAGITEQFVPGKTWNRSALERKGNKTDYNALKGFDTYIQQASDNIFHTENIQKLRGLENEIRYQYSDKGIQERIDEILSNETLFQEEKQDLIDKIFTQANNPMPNLVTELRRYTNALANKKSEADRSTEQTVGRQFYNTINAIENRFGANAVGLNIGSAITNFIPITQAYSQVNTKNMGRAFIDTVKSYVKNDGFVNESTFLTNRLNQSEKLYKTSLEKISDKTSFLFNTIDEVTSNVIVRGKYLENISKGMNKIEAIKNADRFAANIMADRSKGALPTKFEEKNPLTKMFTQFQLEVNNQYRYMFKDIPRDLKDKGIGQITLAFFKMFIGAWLYNEASEEVTGRKSAFSPIDLAISSYDNITDEDKTTYDKMTSVATEIGQQAPFVGGLLGGGRVPVNGAIPNMGNLVKASTGLATGEMDFKKAKETIGKELSKPLYYILPPFGGGQMKKTIEGIETVKNGGSYGVDDKGEKILKFPIENKSNTNYIKAGIFGKYALEEAKDYSDREYKSLNAKQTKIYEETKLPYKQLLDYIDKGLKKKEDKIQYINSKNMNEQQKWGIYKYDIFSNKEREDGTSELSDIEYIVSNGISKGEFIKIYNKAQEKNIDVPKADEYKLMKENGISLNSYVDYNIKIKNKVKEKRDTGEIKEEQQLKSKDKIQVLLDSNYSSKEKTAIYENYIRTKPKDNEADIFKLLKDSNININEYLKYEQQEFESDIEDDGTEKGKAVTGSKKEKVYEYVNNMKIAREQKILILGKQYKLNYQSEKMELFNYINNIQGQTKKEKLEIFKKYDKNFVIYKDGTISLK